jgi:hypothetical protein
MTPVASWTLVTLVCGIPSLLLWALCRVAGKGSVEEEILAEELLRKSPKPKPPTRMIHHRENVLINFDTMSAADIRHALDNSEPHGAAPDGHLLRNAWETQSEHENVAG